MKNNRIKGMSRILFGVILFASLAVCMMTFGLVSNISSYSALAAESYSYVGEEGVTISVHTPDSIGSGIFYKDLTSSDDGNFMQVNLFKLSVDNTDWLNTMLNNEGKGLMYVTRTILVKAAGGTSNENVSFTMPVASKNNMNSSGYAVLASGKLVGTNYKGENAEYDVYSNNILAGVYKLTDCTFSYNFAKVTSLGEGENASPLSGDPGVSGELSDSSASNLLSSFNILLKSQINLNNSVANFCSNNFGFADESRSYRGENLRDMIQLYKNGETGSIDTDVFYFSATNRNSIDSLGRGLGLEASSTFEPLVDYITIDWYETIPEVGPQKISSLKEVKDAGTYTIMFGAKNVMKLSLDTGDFYSDELNPLSVVLNGAEFAYTLNILPAVLKVDLENEIGINVSLEKPYDNKTDASTLFSNVVMTSEVWEQMGGRDVDATYVTGADNLFDFSDSVFNDASIGENKIVKLKIRFTSVGIEDTGRYSITKNYTIVAYLGDVKCTEVSGMFNIDELNFVISANLYEMRFSQGEELDGKKPLPTDIIYGDILSATDINYKEHIVMPDIDCTEMGENSGLFNLKMYPEWSIFIGNNITDVPATARANVILLTVSSAVMVDESTTNPSFVDKEGKKYNVYSNRFYVGEYFFIYNAQIRYQDGTVISDTKSYFEEGVFNVKDKSGTVLFKVSFDPIQYLKVDKKKITVSVDSLEPQKYYDGTTDINTASLSYEGIVPADEEGVLEFSYNVHYAAPGASNNVAIVYDLNLIKKSSGVTESIFNNTKNSYEIDIVNLINNTGLDILSGSILPLELKASFVKKGETYSRMYMTDTYVAVTGLGIPEGYCYYYVWNGTQGSQENGICEIELLQEKYSNCTYIEVNLEGFFEGEGFSYGTNGLSNFMIIKNSSNPEEYYPDRLDAHSLLSWMDTEKNVELNYDTASNNDGESYRLEINDGYLLSNYKIVSDPGEYAYLVIEKRELGDEIKIIDDNDSNRMEYTRNDHLNQVFDPSAGKVNMTSHPEYAQLTNKESFLKVDSFVTNCTVVSHTHEFSQNDINNLILSGTYDITLNIPSTTNYKAYSTSFQLTIHPKEVEVYLTLAMRYYKDPEVEYTQQAYISNIEDHVIYVDAEGEDSDQANGNRVYAYQKDKVNGLGYVLYCGFLGSDVINSSDMEEKLATVSVSLPNGVDAAGHDGRVFASGAIKHNYTFAYNDTPLYVKRKPLTLVVDELQQEKDYTGSQVTIDYRITGGPGALGMYVIGYTPTIGVEPERYAEEDETNTDVIESGEYLLKVYAKPEGNDANNYATSEVRTEVRLTLNKIKLELVEGADVTVADYTGLQYTLRNFNDYFIGKGSDGLEIPAGSLWGTVNIRSAKNNEGVDVQINEVVNAGEYILTVEANIYNANNVYFEEPVNPAESKFTYVNSVNGTFELKLTVSQADDYNFVITKSSSITDIGFYKYTAVFNGFDEESDDIDLTRQFGYNLTFVGMDANNGEVNVVITIDDVLYAINTKKYLKSSAADVSEANGITNKIPGVNYDITSRNSLFNHGDYTIKYYVNNPSSIDYDDNLISFEVECKLTINKQELKVYLGFYEDMFDTVLDSNGEEVPIPHKVYKTPNSELEEKIYLIYEGWVSNETNKIILDENAPTLDWTYAPENATVSSDCRIGLTDGSGVAPDNYYFNYENTSVLRILRAESSIIVFGEGDFNQRTEYADNLVYTFDTIYKMEEDELGAQKVVEFVDFDKGDIADRDHALNYYYYYDYTVYAGVALKPQVLRMAGSEPINEVEESVGGDGVKIELVGRYNGKNKTEISDVDVDKSVKTHVDSGEYVFKISVNASANYKAIPEKYYYLRIVKNKLTVEVVPQEGNVSVSKVYDKEYKYPTYSIKYSGFVGVDSGRPEYTNVFLMKHVSEYTSTVVGIPDLGLVHPYYELTDISQTRVVQPIDVGTYRARILISKDNKYGFAKNYIIEAKYDQSEGNDVYPNFEITKRPVRIERGAKIQKTYDASTKVPRGLITTANYKFIAVKGNDKSGVIAGDEIELDIIYDISSFASKNVQQDPIEVKVYFNKVLTNNNYMLQIDELQNDEKGTFIFLNGEITPAAAEIRFYSDDLHTNVISGKYEVEYDAQSHPVYPVVSGVLKEDGTRETVVNYTILYICEAIGYSREDAPTNAETYKVQLKVNDSNYSEVQRGIDLVIKKAEADIIFGGDVVQVYGAIITGLSATAVKDFGVQRYSKPLSVYYYDVDGNKIEDIKLADAGEYRAVSIHMETTNFKRSEKEIQFLIKRRGVHVSYFVLSSYDYSGGMVPVDISFEYNNKIFRPNMLFYNAEGEVLSSFPIDVGDYYVGVDNSMKNFDILDEYKAPFAIIPIGLTISVTDKVITVGDTVGYELKEVGAINGERISDIFVNMPTVEYYSAVTGERVDNPQAVGTYKVVPVGGEAKNYIVDYEHGILIINKNMVQQFITNSTFATTGDVVVEGSFEESATLVVKTADTIEYNRYVTAFESAKLADEALNEYSIFDVYHLKLNNGDISSQNGQSMKVKIYAKHYFDKLGENYEGAYNAARISSDGSIVLLEGEREDDYLVIYTEKLEAFALLIPGAQISLDSASNDYDWVLYVGIAVGVILIGVALIIVKVRA